MEYTLDEKIELFKYNLNTTLVHSDLPVSVTYFVLKELLEEIKTAYQAYSRQVVQDLEKKITPETEE